MYLPLVLEHLGSWRESGEERSLAVLAALARGSASGDLQGSLSEVLATISCENVLHMCRPEHQSALLSLTEVILTKCDPSDNSFDIFRILVFVASSSEAEDNVNLALGQLEVLAEKTGCGPVSELYRKHLGAVLKDLLSSAPAWMEHSPQFLMFVGLLELAGTGQTYTSTWFHEFFFM